jgi:hypothetical protein
MSLIHLDKSVVSLHVKEILEDGHLGGPLTLMSLSALFFGPKLLSNLTVAPRRVTQRSTSANSPYRPCMSLSAWVAHVQKQQSRLVPNGAMATVPLAVAENPPVVERLAA